MTVSTLHSSEQSCLNGSVYPPSAASTASIPSSSQDDPHQKYARVLYEHTRRQMDVAAHSIHADPTSSSSTSTSPSSDSQASISSREGRNPAAVA